jgi:spore coat protein U-like protein
MEEDMKKFNSVILALALTGILSAGNAFGAGTATVEVSATVQATCKFNSGGLLAFGTLDPLSESEASVTNAAAANFTCTNGTTYAISDNGGGQDYKLAQGTDFIAYSLDYTKNGVGTGNATPLSITATIPFAAYQHAPAGNYTDTVTLSINP